MPDSNPNQRAELITCLERAEIKIVDCAGGLVAKIGGQAVRFEASAASAASVSARYVAVPFLAALARSGTDARLSAGGLHIALPSGHVELAAQGVPGQEPLTRQNATSTQTSVPR